MENLSDINAMEDYNQPNERRRELLEIIDKRIGNVGLHFWAACHTCDLSKLEALSQKTPGDIQNADTGAFDKMVRHWGSAPSMQSRPSSPRTPTKGTPRGVDPSPPAQPSPSKRQKICESPATTLRRDANAKRGAEERDNFGCVLTGLSEPDIAHIYPHSAIKNREPEKHGPRHAFWNQLDLYWPEEKIAAWQKKIFPDGIDEKGIEAVYNLVSLAPHVHRYWGRGRFALKPVSESDDHTTLRLQFFWQIKQAKANSRIPLTTKPLSTEGYDRTPGAHGRYAYLDKGNRDRIRSGDFIELRTDNPKEKPLPSFELLELQWFLQRIQGMAGAAIDGDPWRDAYPDPDDTIEGVPGLASDDEIEEFSLLFDESIASPEKIPNLPLLPKHLTREGEGGTDWVMGENQIA